MVRAVYGATNDTALLAEAYEALQLEHAYWTSPPKTLAVATPRGAFNFSRYYAEWQQPRPESYLCAPLRPLCPRTPPALTGHAPAVLFSLSSL